MPEKVKKVGWHKQLEAHNKTKRRSMTLVEALERDERQQRIPEPPLSNNNTNNNDMPLQGYSPPPSTAPPALISQKRARKHTTVYRETFRDSQDNPTAGIKRGKVRRLL
jgi:hypothetical protein